MAPSTRVSAESSAEARERRLAEQRAAQARAEARADARREAERARREGAEDNWKNLPQPPQNAKRIPLGGDESTDKYTFDLFKRAQKISGVPMSVVQGNHSHDVAASAGTHSGTGALDIRTRDKSPAQVQEMVEGLRKAGFAAWYRSGGSWTGNEHIHAVAIGAEGLQSLAADQVQSYLNGGDGLAGNGRDPHLSSIGRPLPKWVGENPVAPTGGPDAAISAAGGPSSAGGSSSVGSQADWSNYSPPSSTRPPTVIPNESSVSPNVAPPSSSDEMFLLAFLESMLGASIFTDNAEYQAWLEEHPGMGVNEYLQEQLRQLDQHAKAYMNLKELAKGLRDGDPEAQRLAKRLGEALVDGPSKPRNLKPGPVTIRA